MNAKKIIVLFVLLGFLSNTAAEAFPSFFRSNTGFNNGSNYCSNWGGYRHCRHHRHHHRW